MFNLASFPGSHVWAHKSLGMMRLSSTKSYLSPLNHVQINLWPGEPILTFYAPIIGGGERHFKVNNKYQGDNTPTQKLPVMAKGLWQERESKSQTIE